MKLLLKRRKRSMDAVRLTGLILLACLIVFSSSSIALALDEYQYDSKFGSNGAGDGQFDNPVGAAIDSNGNIYVADTANHRIQKFDSSGTFVSKFGTNGTGDGQFNLPYDVAIDSNGDIYVADGFNHRIQKFNPNGTFVSKFGSLGNGDGQFSVPIGIDLDSNGNVYVADHNNHRIQKFDSNGTFITKFGTNGTGNGQFKNPYDVAIDSDGDIYVADGLNHRIQKFNSNGTFVTKWGKNGGDGTSGTGDGEFNQPAGLDIDSSGNIYVTDYGNNRIQKFNSNAVFATKFGSLGNGDGQFTKPAKVCVDSNSALYITDTSNDRIQRFVRTDASFVSSDKSWLTFDKIKKSNTDEDEITSNLDLKTSGPNGSNIFWTSNNASVIGTDGKVTRPPYGNSDAGVTVTATITKGTAADTKAFNLNVKASTDAPAEPEPTSTATSFTDIPSGAWYKSYVDTLVGKGIISGYADNTFRPGHSVTRAEFSKMLGLALAWTIKTPVSSSFSDVALDNWASRYVEAAKLHNALNGYPDGTFNPNKAITRAEIATIIARVKSYASSPAAFTDTNGHWANGSIGACNAAGILSGYPGGTFKPDGPANRAEAAKLIAALL